MSAAGPAWQPRHQVELVAGTPAGGGQDRPARALIKVLESQRLVDVPLKLTNIPGRGGGNGWDYLHRHAEDPHVLAISSPTLITNALLGEAGINHTAFTPLAILYTEYTAFVARADSPIHSSAGLLERLADPGSLTIALATAIGNTNHIALARVTQHAGGDVKALKFRVFDSALYAVADVIEGRSDIATITAVSAAKELAAGTLRAFAVSAPARLTGQFAQVPTWHEQSVDCVIGMWRGVIGARGLKPEQVAFWDNAFTAAAASDDWNAELAHHYWANTYLDSARTGKFLAQEHVAMQKALGDLGLLKAANSKR